MKQTSMTRTRLRTVDLAYAALFAVLLMVCAWINIPLTVPFTLQTFGVFAALGTLGGRRGTLAILAYLLLGLVGLPVFSGFQGGPGVLLGTTGGYILGFLASALLYWGMTARLGDRPAVLLSGFTDNWRELLLGVDIGGLGTPVASLASLITLKLYLRSPGARPARYLAVFTAWNAALLAVLLAAVWLTSVGA